MGYEDWYVKVSAPFRVPGRKRGCTALAALDRALVGGVAGAYAAELAYLAASRDAHARGFFAVPAATFMLVSALRAAIDRPRPYESHAIEPLIPKDTHGKSLPSRHVASAVVIACGFIWLDKRLAAPAIATCALVAATRVLGGNHYPGDVAAAAALAATCGRLGFGLADRFATIR